MSKLRKQVLHPCRCKYCQPSTAVILTGLMASIGIMWLWQMFRRNKYSKAYDEKRAAGEI